MFFTDKAASIDWAITGGGDSIVWVALLKQAKGFGWCGVITSRLEVTSQSRW